MAGNCPHCGCEAIFFNDFKDAGRVICTNCGCSTPTASKESAIAIWNRREGSCLGCIREDAPSWQCVHCNRNRNMSCDFWEPKEVGR